MYTDHNTLLFWRAQSLWRRSASGGGVGASASSLARRALARCVMQRRTKKLLAATVKMERMTRGMTMEMRVELEVRPLARETVSWWSVCGTGAMCALGVLIIVGMNERLISIGQEKERNPTRLRGKQPNERLESYD